MSPRVLVAGIGNIFLGDDAFGVEVVRRLAARGLPDDVRLVDFGIRGLDLTYALLDGYDAVVLIDAAPRGGSPGTLYVLELDVDNPADLGADVFVEPHRLDPAQVLRLAASWGAQVGRLILVGCEPSPLNEAEDFGIEMSPVVQAAVTEAVPLIEALVERLLQGQEVPAAGDDTHLGFPGFDPRGTN